MLAQTALLVPARLRRKLRAYYYWGWLYRCPLCRSPLRTFLPFGFKFPVLKAHAVVGGGYRPRALCPICYALDRERLLYLFLRRKTDIFTKRTRLLHVAPEAQVSEILKKQPNVDYVTADLYSERAMVKMNVTTIPFPSHYFNAIICNHVLEHVVNDRTAMAELYRTLAPGGWAILQVPMSWRLDRTYEDSSIMTPAGRAAAFGQHDHVRIYARDYVERLEQTGFKVDVFNWTSEAKHFGEIRNRFGLNENEAVYFATKPPE